MGAPLHSRDADKSSNLAIMRRAKRETGYSGIRGTSANFGDMMEFRPAGICHVMFVTFGE